METILIAEDESEVRHFLGLALSCNGYRVEFAQNGEEVVKCLSSRAADISLLLLDLIMPQKDGFMTLREVRRTWPALPVITISGACSPHNIVSTLKGGAVDFLPKPVSAEDLLNAVRSGLAGGASWLIDGHGGRRVPTPYELSSRRPTSTGTWSARVESLLKQVGLAEVPLLLRGETGVGKEVLARRFHLNSPRAQRPFLKLNCAALPSELVESELFGYERGAFTGAFKNSPGKFEMANGGTILLDEIGDMDFKLQAKLLQVLQDGEFLRLGAREPSKVDVRVMAATHCDLEKAITEGKFREDLYYRLNILDISIPPLRERRDEILTLAELFIREYSGQDAPRPEITPALQQALLDHDWPGNVRELENAMRKLLVFGNPDLLVEELNCKSRRKAPGVAIRPALRPSSAETFLLRETRPDGALAAGNSESSPQDSDRFSGSRDSDCGSIPEQMAPPPSRRSLPLSEPSYDDNVPIGASTILERVDQARKEAESEAILAALNAALWNRKQAAAALGVDYKALLYKMKKLGIGDKSLFARKTEAQAAN